MLPDVVDRCQVQNAASRCQMGMVDGAVWCDLQHVFVSAACPNQTTTVAVPKSGPTCTVQSRLIPCSCIAKESSHELHVPAETALAPAGQAESQQLTGGCLTTPCSITNTAEHTIFSRMLHVACHLVSCRECSTDENTQSNPHCHASMLNMSVKQADMPSNARKHLPPSQVYLTRHC